MNIYKTTGLFSFWIFFQAGILYGADIGDIVITEFFFSSKGLVPDYIEIYNTTNNPIDLKNWNINNEDKDNNIVEGDPDIIKTVKDVWKFSKNMWSHNPTWYLVDTTE